MSETAQEIISTPEQLRACCELLANCPQIGFDTEFVGEDSYHPELCLLQVAAPGRLFLIDPFSVGPLDAFWRLLHDPHRTAIVHAGREEVRLCRHWSGAPPANLFDLQIAAGLVTPNFPLGHGNLVQQVLGQRLSKGETLTEWRRRPLTPEQITYAFDDVRFLLRLWEKLHGRLERLERMGWAKEEFDRLCRNVGSAEVLAEEERWRKLRGVASLDRRKLAVVRALFDWREAKAAASNRPARTVVRDDLLIEIARRVPRAARDLQVIRGLAHRDLDAIFDVVTQARDLPIEQCPVPAEREQDPPQMALVANVLIAVLGDFCSRNRLAVGLVTTNTDVRALVRARIAGEQAPPMLLTQGWRAEHVLPVLLDVLEGRRAVRIADPSAEAPLALGPAGEPPG